MSSTQQLLLGEGAGGPVTYIEDVFSTYLYTGNGNSARSISNGIDLSTKGGMVWLKNRTNAYYNNLFDTARGVEKRLYSNTTDAQVTTSGSLTAFNTDGFSLGTASFGCNDSGNNIASWTFRKQPKFFDVVTYTGNGTAGRTISHSLGSVPGCIIVKDYANAGNNWKVYHRSLGGTKFINLSATTAAGTDIAYWNNTDPTSTVFTVGDDSSVNGSGRSYVAYIFAHDAGGFGLTGTDNVISCGSTTNGSTVNLGYEPQWVLMKNTAVSQDWFVWDTMRGMALTYSEFLYPNLSSAAVAGATAYVIPTATGFTLQNLSPSNTYIYITIRRGPMKVPTDATKVFAPYVRTGTNSVTTVTTPNFAPDLLMTAMRNTYSSRFTMTDKLRGVAKHLFPAFASAENNDTDAISAFTNTGITYGADNTSGYYNLYTSPSNLYLNYTMQRAPQFFDEVCYTGTGVARTLNHNLGISPQLIIVKGRSGGGDSNNWAVSDPSNGWTNYLSLNTTNATSAYVGLWNDTAPTASVFSLGDSGGVNQSGTTYVAWLFATCAGVSKVGSYTGTGATQTIDCGFAGGARFVLVKRTDSTGDWYVWDTARGMVAGTDPSLLLNSTTAEVNANSIYTTTGGFQIVSTAAGINASGGSYIYMAIA